MAKRKALCVAIDDYGHPANNLNSCIADAKAFEQLVRTKYDFDEVRSHHDAEATVKNVEEALDWLFEDPQPDDRLVFYFSGHGYQMPSNDVLEEVLVLRDDFFRDDRLSERSQALPPGVFTAVLDSCFSGGMEKLLILTDDGLEVARPKRWTPTDAKQLQKEQTILEKAPKLKLKPFAAKAGGTRRALAKDFGVARIGAGATPIEAPPSDEETQLQMSGLLLSACLEDETASAKTSQTNGLSAFTYGLTEALKELGPRTATTDLIAAVQKRLKAMGFRQTPLMKDPVAINLGERSFLLLEPVERPAPAVQPAAPDIERIIELIRNSLKEGMSMPEAADDKFLGAIVSAVSTVAPHVLPHVISALRKDYQPGLGQPAMAPQPAGDEKFFGAIVSAVSAVAPHVLPHVIDALRKEYQPGLGQPAMAPQTAGDEKFFGSIVSAVSAVAPHVLPHVISALRKEYQPGLGQPAMAPQPAGDEKFFGAIVSAVSTVAPHVLPHVISALRKEYQPVVTAPTTAAVH